MFKRLSVCALVLASVQMAFAQPGELPAPPAPAVKSGITFADIHRRAQELAGGPFVADRPELPDIFANMTYDQHRSIRFREDKTVWRDEGLPFQVQLFHRGFIFVDRVRINIIDQGEPKPIDYSAGLFDYDKLTIPQQLPLDLGFAGFKILYPLHTDDKLDEVAVFLGATYFRAIGQNQNYGVSSRGLAIDTGLSTTEEFPVFREFWIQKPDRDATELIVYALMDSPRATGAYRFIIRPGLHTEVVVKAQVFMRDHLAKLGIAPLTSMFYHGENTERYMDDFRPEVHDSDGLIVETGTGERIWRPLVNPTSLRIRTLQVTNPKGFGLLQRDRDFEHYQDLEAHYHTRPSAWVEPIGDWGKGAVELVEIPSGAERYDNIVAFWVPEAPTQAGQEIAIDYKLRFALEPEARLQGGRVIATRIGAGGSDEPVPTKRKFVIDFAGGVLRKLNGDMKVEAVVSNSSGSCSAPVTQYNPSTKGWRVFFELEPASDDPVDLRCFLKLDQDVLTETWSFQWVRN